MSLLDFFMDSGKLKDVKRKGWLIDGVKDPESVADHSFRAALMVMVLCPKNLDRDRAIKMALIHDLAESITGDIVMASLADEKEKQQRKFGQFDHITPGEKKKREHDAMKELLKGFDSKEIAGLWEECEKCESPESKFVKAVDMVEMCLQALDYELKENHQVEDLGHYFRATRKKINDPGLLRLFDEIESRRPKG